MQSDISSNVLRLSPEQHGRVATLRTQAQQLRHQLKDIEEQISAAHSRKNLVEMVNSVIVARKQRNSIFDSKLFADPAWDMLLELYVGALDQQRLPVTKLCDASGVPVTTGLRWIEKLSSEGLVVRREDPLDGRRIWVALSDKGLSAMDQYFVQLWKCSAYNVTA